MLAPLTARLRFGAWTRINAWHALPTEVSTEKRRQATTEAMLALKPGLTRVAKQTVLVYSHITHDGDRKLLYYSPSVYIAGGPGPLRAGEIEAIAVVKEMLAKHGLQPETARIETREAYGAGTVYPNGHLSMVMTGEPMAKDPTSTGHVVRNEDGDLLWQSLK